MKFALLSAGVLALALSVPAIAAACREVVVRFYKIFLENRKITRCLPVPRPH